MSAKLERQMNLLATLLHTGRHLQASELSERVEGYPDEVVAFRRAFERDKDDLRTLGIPIDMVTIESADGPVHAYRVKSSDYYLHDLNLTAEETVALALALRVIGLDGTGSGDTARWKLGGGIDDDGVVPGQLARISAEPALVPVQQAIQDRVTLRFRFRGEARAVEPWRMWFRAGHWYVGGHDPDRDATRQFRLDRVEGPIEVDRHRPAEAPRGKLDANRRPWEFDADAASTTVARLWVAPSHAWWCQHNLGGAAVVAEHPDGAIEIEFEVRNRAGFRNLVLGLHDAAEVLSPPQLRAELVEWLEALA